MTYSLDFRRKVLSIREKEGLTISEVASRFWVKSPVPRLGRNKPSTKIDMQALANDIHQYPDAYQKERAERLGVSQQGIYCALGRLGVTYKKKPYVTQERTQTNNLHSKSLGKPIVCGFAHDMPRDTPPQSKQHN